MRRSMFAVPALLAVCLACSGGTSHRKTSPAPTPRYDSLADVLISLSNKVCSLRETTGSSWVIEFKKGGAAKTFEVERVGTDYVRLKQGSVLYDLPFSSIALVNSDD